MIKNFLYLNEPKLYSFSSQLFEGITEYVLNEEQLQTTDDESQSGKMHSGRVIADVIKETSTSTTKKFLHDHSFNLFEKELVESNILIDSSTDELSFNNICNSGKSFIRIRAKGKFVDINEIQTLFNNYAKIGEAIAILPLTDEMQELELLKAKGTGTKEVKEKQSNLDKLFKKRTMELTSGLPPRSIKSFETIIESFGDDIVRFQQQINDVIFSTCLTQENLREPLKNIYRKYSRKTAKEFIVLGFISHADGTQAPEVKQIPEGASMLHHMIGMAENMYELEQTFGKKMDNEIIIEPIAIYTEL